MNRRLEAEKSLLEWQARQRLSRARNSRHRPCFDFVPGELVYYWRTQDSNKGRRQPGGKHGRFLGPGTGYRVPAGAYGRSSSWRSDLASQR